MGLNSTKRNPVIPKKTFIKFRCQLAFIGGTTIFFDLNNQIIGQQLLEAYRVNNSNMQYPFYANDSRASNGEPKNKSSTTRPTTNEEKSLFDDKEENQTTKKRRGLGPALRSEAEVHLPRRRKGREGGGGRFLRVFFW